MIGEPLRRRAEIGSRRAFGPLLKLSGTRSAEHTRRNPFMQTKTALLMYSYLATWDSQSARASQREAPSVTIGTLTALLGLDCWLDGPAWSAAPSITRTRGRERRTIRRALRGLQSRGNTFGVGRPAQHADPAGVPVVLIAGGQRICARRPPSTRTSFHSRSYATGINPI
jgi:hypothetical protein